MDLQIAAISFIDQPIKKEPQNMQLVLQEKLYRLRGLTLRKLERKNIS